MSLHNAETPSISASSYASSALVSDQLLMGHGRAHPLAGALRRIDRVDLNDLHSLDALKQAVQVDKTKTTQPIQKQGTSMAPPSMRFVKIYIADINENLPLGKRMVYTGDETFTDLTDQELFFEVPITTLLAAHNAMRTLTVDKAQSEKFGRDVFLEPVRIRDLKMVVVTLAAF